MPRNLSRSAHDRRRHVHRQHAEHYKLLDLVPLVLPLRLVNRTMLTPPPASTGFNPLLHTAPQFVHERWRAENRELIHNWLNAKTAPTMEAETVYLLTARCASAKTSTVQFDLPTAA
jgi:hypothetical protein